MWDKGEREGVGGSGSGVLTIATIVSDTQRKKMMSVILIMNRTS